MKRSAFLMSGLFLLAAAMPALAQETTEDKQADTAAVEVEKTAATPEGQERVAAKIKAQFGVDDARVQAMKDSGLNNGEIQIALALAQGMPGGITDENVQKLTALRQGPPKAGWGKIAKDLGLKIGPAIAKTKKAAAELRKEEAKAKKAKAMKEAKEKKGGKGMKGGKGDKPAKMDRPAKGGGKK
ncbi:MAG: hypothetical protein AB7V08_10310 [Elusimicrobiales bacterium]